MKEYTIQQLQFKGGLDEKHWVTIWSGFAKNEKDAKRKALKEITLIVKN